MKKFLDSEEIAVQAWYPLGHGDETLMKEPLFAFLGDKYGKSSAQIILRWHIQAGNIIIPGSKNPKHIKDNFDLYDFSLSEEEMQKIYDMDKQKRYYVSSPALLKKYAEMVPPVDSQKMMKKDQRSSSSAADRFCYVPGSYDGSSPYALFITLPGYEGLYFQGVGVNLRSEDFGFEAQDYNDNMIIAAPQLEDGMNCRRIRL